MDKISFTDLTLQEAQILWNMLLEAPGKVCYPLAKKLEAQLLAQGALENPAPPAEKGEVVP